MSRSWWCAGAISALLLLAVLVVWTSPFFVGSPFGMVVAGVAWLAVLAGVATLGVLSGRRWLAVSAPVVTVVLAAATVNWSVVAPATYFELHRPLYDHAVANAHPDDSFYGADLPVALRPLAAQGRVARVDGMLFFPQWIGIPDDAGGYWWSPDRSPAGADMFGMACVHPEPLGGGWWACGL